MKTKPVLFVPFFLLSACATKSDFNYVQTEVSKLKEDSQSIKSQSAGSYSEITQYREEVASLKGGLEVLRHDNAVSIRRLDVEDSLMVKKTDDLDARLARIEQALGIHDGSAVGKPGMKGAAKTADEAGKDKSAAVALTGEEMLNAGLKKMGKTDFAGARANFTEFMSKNPKSPKVADAQFYIAESYYNEKWFEKAILEYQVVIEKFTKSPKRPASLYKQAICFEKIGQKANAKALFKDVVSLYPSSPEAKLARKKLQ